MTNNRVEVYTTDEIKELKSVVKGTDMELSVALLFDCVMRRGELLGLAFEDIDFGKNIVKIRHSWVESEDSKKPVLKDCKTDGSYREMVVSEETMRLLKRQKVYCKTICLREGKPFTGKQRVICKEDGNPFLPKSYTSKWNKTLKNTDSDISNYMEQDIVQSVGFFHREYRSILYRQELVIKILR